MERVAGIGPASSAWKAEVIPLYDTRKLYISGLDQPIVSALPVRASARFLPLSDKRIINDGYKSLITFLANAALNLIMVEGGGFEPPKVEPADLQSAPFGRSGTPPNKVRILYMAYGSVNSNNA